MDIFILQKHHVLDTVFLKDFSDTFQKSKTKSLILHENTDGLEFFDTLFQTKRITAFLSERMIASVGLSGTQRSLIRREKGKVFIRKELLDSFFENLQTIVLSNLCMNEKKVSSLPLAELINAFSSLYDSKIFLFPYNSLSQLGNETAERLNKKILSTLKQKFPEEEKVFQLANSLNPEAGIYIRSCKNFI